MTESDLTAYARIRNAALQLFATRGTAGTSIRDVARAAGVSPGLVQHHFGTKAALRRAVDEFVLEDAKATVTDLPGDVGERAAEFAARIGAVARDRPEAMRYLARSVSEGDAAGLAIFKALVDFGLPQLREMEEAGQLAPELDVEWAALQLLMFNLSSLLFEPAITDTLGEPLLSEHGLRRWNAAAMRLFTRGFTRQ